MPILNICQQRIFVSVSARVKNGKKIFPVRNHFFVAAVL